MITAFCANPCIDRTIEIEKFTYAGMNRIVASREDGSGKGVNVAIAICQMGGDAACIGILGSRNGDAVLERMEGVACDFITFDGNVRINTKMLDRSTGKITEINDRGVAVTAEQVEAMVEQCVRWAKKSTFMVLSGSLPPGCPDDLYATICERIRAEVPACRVLLDAEGEKLRLGLKAHPTLIKPNQYEFELLAGRELPTVQDVHEEACRWIAEGVTEMIVVSMGGDGAYLHDGRQAYFAPIIPVPVRSTVGAGDSMVAGMMYAFDRGLDAVDAFCHGVAAATSSVTTEGTELVDAEVYQQMLSRVELQKLEMNV